MFSYYFRSNFADFSILDPGYVPTSKFLYFSGTLSSSSPHPLYKGGEEEKLGWTSILPRTNSSHDGGRNSSNRGGAGGSEYVAKQGDDITTNTSFSMLSISSPPTSPTSSYPVSPLSSTVSTLEPSTAITTRTTRSSSRKRKTEQQETTEYRRKKSAHFDLRKVSLDYEVLSVSASAPLVTSDTSGGGVRESIRGDGGEGAESTVDDLQQHQHTPQIQQQPQPTNYSFVGNGVVDSNSTAVQQDYSSFVSMNTNTVNTINSTVNNTVDNFYSDSMDISISNVGEVQCQNQCQQFSYGPQETYYQQGQEVVQQHQQPHQQPQQQNVAIENHFPNYFAPNQQPFCEQDVHQQPTLPSTEPAPCLTSSCDMSQEMITFFTDFDVFEF